MVMNVARFGKFVSGLFGKSTGKQIGKVSKTGLRCFEKTTKNGRVRTILDSRGNIVRRQHTSFNSDQYRVYTNYDSKGNVLSNTEIIKTPKGYGLASRNQYASNVRVVTERYNKFGQVTHNSDVSISPNLSKPRLDVFSYVNGNVSKTYMNTATGNKYTINCVKS